MDLQYTREQAVISQNVLTPPAKSLSMREFTFSDNLSEMDALKLKSGVPNGKINENVKHTREIPIFQRE